MFDPGKKGGTVTVILNVFRLISFQNSIFTRTQKARLHERKKWNASDKKWNGSDKKWNGSDKFLRVNDTWPVPILPVPLKKGSIGAYGPFSERNG